MIKDDKREIMFSGTFRDYSMHISKQATKDKMLREASGDMLFDKFEQCLEAWLASAEPGDVWVNPVEDRYPEQVFCHFQYEKEGKCM